MKRPTSRPAPSAPLPGELRFLSSGTTRRLALVLAAYPTHLVFAIAHPYVEYATSADAVLAREATGTGYAVVVCCDCVGTAFATQFDPTPVGVVPEPVLAAARRFDASLIPAREWCWTGTRLAGPLDARWDLKVELRDATRRLAAPSLELLLG